MCNKRCFNTYCPTHKKIIDKRAVKENINKAVKKKLNEEFANSPLANVIIDIANSEYHNKLCICIQKR